MVAVFGRHLARQQRRAAAQRRGRSHRRGHRKISRRESQLRAAHRACDWTRASRRALRPCVSRCACRCCATRIVANVRHQRSAAAAACRIRQAAAARRRCGVFASERAKAARAGSRRLLPRGKSDKLLAPSSRAYCPMLVVQSEDGTWEVDENVAARRSICPTTGTSARACRAELPLFSIDRGTNAEPRFLRRPAASRWICCSRLEVPAAWSAARVVTVTSLGAAGARRRTSRPFRPALAHASSFAAAISSTSQRDRDDAADAARVTPASSQFAERGGERARPRYSSHFSATTSTCRIPARWRMARFSRAAAICGPPRSQRSVSLRDAAGRALPFPAHRLRSAALAS